MINSILFEGVNVEIRYRSNKIIKHRATICCYNDKYFRLVEKSIGKILIVKGEFYEICYKDKYDNWINSYTIRAKDIKKAL